MSGAQRGIGGQRADDQCGLKYDFGFEQCGERHGRRELRSVEQRESFLGTEHERFEPRQRQSFHRWESALFGEHIADAEHGRRHVSERGEIARCADRALRRHDGNDVVREHRFQERDRLVANTGGALAQTHQLQRHHQPGDVGRQRLADAGRMRQHDVLLQLGQIGGVDTNAGELAEAGVDAIDGLAFRDDLRDHLGAALDGGAAVVVQFQAGATIDRPPVSQGHRAGCQNKGGHRLSRCGRITVESHAAPGSAIVIPGSPHRRSWRRAVRDSQARLMYSHNG